jgi:hypothetical protein
MNRLAELRIVRKSIVSIICLFFISSLGCKDEKAILQLSDSLLNKEWKYHGTNEDGSRDYYDQQSITLHGNNTIRVWTKTEFSKDSSSYKRAKITMMLLHDEINCKDSTSRIVEGIGFLENGYKDTVSETEPQKITKGLGKKFITLICDEKIK